MYVTGSNVTLGPGRTYETWPLPLGTYPIKEMEVFQVNTSSPRAKIANSKGNTTQDRMVGEPVTKFTNEINNSINAKLVCLLRAESEMLQLEESFKDEQTFIMKFASGDTKDVVVLNVSGTVMVTKRSTLCTAKDSVLAQQFDDSKRTEQGCNAPRVNEWNPDQVSTWAKSVDGLPEDVSIILYENEITGRELLALTRDDLKMMGMKRVDVALLLEEIKELKQASQDIVTLIEHLKGLIAEETGLPKVCDLQKMRFEKVVKYYFPGDNAKFMLG